MTVDAVWAVVMFDLPVQTATQRRAATGFRMLLLDLGFSMIQYSVYARYTPTGVSGTPALAQIKQAIPPDGLVRILHVTDAQWSRTEKFYGGIAEPTSETPQQLLFF